MPRIPHRIDFRENHFKIVYRHVDAASGRADFYTGTTKRTASGNVIAQEEAGVRWETEEEALAWLNSPTP